MGTVICETTGRSSEYEGLAFAYQEVAAILTLFIEAHKEPLSITINSF